MNVIDPIISEFSQESATTRKMLERIPEKDFGWKPHEKSMTMCQLASHIVESIGFAEMLLEMDEFDIDPSSFKPWLADNTAELLEQFDKNVAKATELMKKQTDESLMQIWTMKIAGEVAFAIPRMASWRGFIVNHNVHHRGQLSVFLRLRDVPVPPVYGPTADEEVAMGQC